MEKEKLTMCRICLVEDVRMYAIVNKNLQEFYEKLTDVPFVAEDGRLMLACFFCCAKLKQCSQFQRKCLEAEERFTKMMSEDCIKPTSMNHGQLEFYGGFIKTPVEHINIDDECKIENNAIKEELPDVCESQDDNKQEKQQSYELNQKNVHTTYLNVGDKTLPQSEEDSGYYVPLTFEFKTEMEDKQKVPMKEQRASKEGNAEQQLHNSYPGEEPSHRPEDSGYFVPLIEVKTEVEDVQEVALKKRKSRMTYSTPAAKKPKLNLQRDIKTNSISQKQGQEKHTKKKKFESAINDILKTKPKVPVLNNYIIKICNNEKKSKEKKINNEKKSKKERSQCVSKDEFKCKICNFIGINSSDMETHSLRHKNVLNKDRPYKCDICQRSFGFKQVLENHIRTHTGEKPYKCNICQRNFSLKHHLNTHIRTHTGNKNFKCDVCQKSFNRLDNLNAHVRTHTGEKPYKCGSCDSAFCKNSDLKRHFRTHTGEKPYKCDICASSFGYKYDLKKHIRTHTGEKPYKCDICESSFSQKVNLKAHIRTHSKSIPKCD